MASKRKDPVVTEFSAEALEALVARCSERLPPEDQALLTRLTEAFLVVSRMLREGRATIKRLRRLFGLQRSEKRRKVFPDGSGSNTGGAGSANGGPTTPDDAPLSPTGQSSPTGEQTGAAPPASSPPAQPGKGHGRRAAADYPDAEHIFVVHDILATGCGCPTCERGSLYDLNRPSSWLRIFGQPLLFAKRWDLQQLRCGACGQVFTASPPPEARGPKYSESAAAVLALVRFGLGIPYYRLDRLQEALGTPIPDATQWDVLYARALELEPVYRHLLHLAAQASLVHIDDTHVRVLEFMGKRREKLVEQGKLPRPDRTGLFTTGIVAIIPEGQLGLFITGRRHAGENLDALLERRVEESESPLLMSDALGHNVPKDHPVVESNCLTHGRRGVLDQAESFPFECQYVVDQISQIYAAEKACRDEDLSPEARLWLHQLASAPVLDHLRTWMTAQIEEKRVEPNSELGRAFKYMLKRWDKFTVFLHIPGAAIDNNICERLLKLPVLQRKASLFFRGERGAVVGDIYMSLIRTATLHGQNPIDYLTALMTHSQAVAEAPAQWMPWNYRQTLARIASSATTDTAAANAAPVEPTPHMSSAATTTSEMAASSSTVMEPAAPSSPKTPATPAERVTRPSRPCSRSAQSAVPPPAFALFTLFCLAVPLFALLYRPDAFMVSPTITQATRSHTSCAKATDPPVATAPSQPNRPRNAGVPSPIPRKTPRPRPPEAHLPIGRTRFPSNCRAPS